MIRLLGRLGSLILAVTLAVGCAEHDTPPADAEAISPVFRQLSADLSGLAFANTLTPTEQLNIITYLYYYNGGGVAAGDVDGDGLVDLFFTANQGPNRLYVNRGDLRFEDITLARGIGLDTSWSTGAAFTDFDLDGDLDLYVCNVSGVAGLDSRNRLYVNDGTGHFTERAEAHGLALSGLNTQAAFFDADGDGDLDVYQLRHSVHDAGRYADTSARAVREAKSADVLLLRGADGRYDPAPGNAGLRDSRLGYGLDIAVADFDFDGRPDLYVGNDFYEQDYAYRNLGDGRYEAVDWFAHSSQFSMGNLVADFNHDGRLDLFTLDMRPWADSLRKSSSNADELSKVRSRQRRGFGNQYARNCLHLNLPGGFVDVAPQYGVHSADWAWSAAAPDADLDGRLDLIVGNGIVRRPNDLDYLKYMSGAAVQERASNRQLAGLMPPGLVPDRAYRGRAGAAYAQVAEAWGLTDATSTTGLIAVDLDGDGDEDLVGNQINGRALLYENLTLPSGHPEPQRQSVRLALSNAVGTPAVGAAAVVEQGAWRVAISVDPVSSFQSCRAAAHTVALPDPSAPYSVSVVWPYGKTLHHAGLRGDVTLAPGTAGGVDTSLAFTVPLATQPERTYTGFETDPLLPVLTGDERGCKPYDAGVAEVPQVRVDDALSVRQEGCWLRPKQWQLAFCRKAEAGERCGRLSDVDYAARFATFDGGEPGERVVVAFAREARGGLTVLPESRAWRIRGKRMTPVDLPLEGAFGQVTDVVPLSQNAVLVAALWQPVRRLTLDASGDELGWQLDSVAPSGLWQKLVPVAGSDASEVPTHYVLANLGLNTLLAESQAEAVELHVADFDGNGKAEPISVRRDANGVRRTLLGLDPIAKQMPMMRRFFQQYLPFSASTYDEMFPPIDAAGGRVYRAEELRSFTYDVTSGEVRALPFEAQIGTPTAVRREGTQYRIDYESPPARPELGADVTTSLMLDSLRP